MSLSSWLWGASQVDEAIDKATSELLPTGTEDIALNLEIADQIRSKSVQPKDAMRALKRRLNHKNPNVQLLALSLTDTCIKNGGDHFLSEVASREFMDNFTSILKMPVLNLDVKNKILRLVQDWATAFEGKPALSYVGQVYRTLKSEGFAFPPQDLAAASSAMVDTQTAPEWSDSDICLRCRTPFSFTNRKHHCRNCGQVFDQQCSSKVLPLPHYGIAQEVRVCDTCHGKLTKNRVAGTGSGSGSAAGLGYGFGGGGPPGVSAGHGDSPRRRTMSAPRHRSGRNLADEELQRAIQLSLEEVGAANGRSHHRSGYAPSYVDQWQTSEPPIIDRGTRPPGSSAAGSSSSGGSGAYSGDADDENDPDLRAAIEASLREAQAPRPSAPVGGDETPRSASVAPSSVTLTRSQSLPTTASTSAASSNNYDLAPLEADAILTFSQTIQDVEARGGGQDLTRLPAVNELYEKANGLRPKLALSLDDADRKEKTLADMHDKLSQAVKLYDKLLTDQLSRPARRMQQQQQQQQQQGQRYNTIDGSYNQWTGAAAAGPTPGSSYGSPTPATPAPYAVAVHPHAHQAYSQSQSPPPSHTIAARTLASPPPPAPVSTSVYTGYTTTPGLQRRESYAQQQQSMQLSQQGQGQNSYSYPSSSSPPTTVTTQQQQHAFAQHSVISQAQAQYAYATANTPGVGTLSSPPPPPPVPVSAPISAPVPAPVPVPVPMSVPTNTISVPTTTPYPGPPQQQQQQQYPQFPSVPMTAPMPMVPMYGPAGGASQAQVASSPFEQPERKEALLIDL